MPYFKITIVIFKINSLEFVYLQNFAKKTPKCLNLGAKIFYLGFPGLESEKIIVIFEISTLEFV